jgi:hypothetical protein
VLALVSGRAENNFVLGIVTNAVYGFAFLLSIVFRWPLVGIAVGLLAKRGHGWRSNRVERRVFTWLTAMWVGMFAIRVTVEIPLYLSSNVDGLALAKLVLGLPLYAPVVLLTWLFVRGIFSEEDATSGQKNVS